MNRQKLKSWTKILNPNQLGSVPLMMAGVFSVAGFLGVAAIVHRTADDNKSVKLSERHDQAQQSPLNAAVIAKALVSASVDEGSPAWTTPGVINDLAMAPPVMVPTLYLDPYVPSQAVINGTADINASWKKMRDPTNPTVGAASWTAPNFAATRSVTVFVTDSNQILPAQVSAIFDKAANPSGQSLSDLLTLPRSSANIIYSAVNCDGKGKLAASWEGFYCVKAEITSQNFSGLDKSGQPVQAGVNKNTMNLGRLQPPPLPVCNSVTGPANWTRGTPIPVTINATGVVTGYKLTIVVVPDDDERVVASASNTFTAANALNATGDIGPINVATTNTTLIPRYDTADIEVEISGPTGSVPCKSLHIPSIEPPPAPLCQFAPAPARVTPTSPNCKVTVKNGSGAPIDEPVLKLNGAVVSNINWTLVGAGLNTYKTTVPCSLTANTKFDAKITGLAGSPPTPASSDCKQAIVRPDCVWVQTKGGYCPTVCKDLGMTLGRSLRYKNQCVSGEDRADALGIGYYNGTWGGGHEFVRTYPDGGNCWGTRSDGKQQKRDNDRTDVTMGCCCN